MSVVSRGYNDPVRPDPGPDKVIHVSKALIFSERISAPGLRKPIRISVHNGTYPSLVRMRLRIFKVFPRPVTYPYRAKIDNSFHTVQR